MKHFLFFLSCFFTLALAQPITLLTVDQKIVTMKESPSLPVPSALEKFSHALGKTVYHHRWITSFIASALAIGTLEGRIIPKEDLGLYFVFSWILCNTLIKNIAYNFELEEK